MSTPNARAGHPTSERRHPMPGNVLMRVTHMGAYDDGSDDGSDDGRPSDAPVEARTVTDDLDAATVVTSQTRYRDWSVRAVDGDDVPRMHRPVLDLDFPATLVPSSSPGHFHLYLDRHMPWSDYCELLDVMAKVGLLEDGYVKASKARGHTAARLPWVAKGIATPDGGHVVRDRPISPQLAPLAPAAAPAEVVDLDALSSDGGVRLGPVEVR